MPIIDSEGRTSINTIRTTISGGSNSLGSYYKTPNGATPTSYSLVPNSGTIAYSMFRSGVTTTPEEPEPEPKTENIDAYTYRLGKKTGIKESDPLSMYLPSHVKTIMYRTANNGDFPRVNSDPNNFIYSSFDVTGKTVLDFRYFIHTGAGGRTGGRGATQLSSEGTLAIIINGLNPDGTRTDANSSNGATGPGGNIMFLEDAKYADGSKATAADIASGGQYPYPIQWGPRGRPTFTDDCFDEMFGPIDTTKVNFIHNNCTYGYAADQCH